MSNNRQKAIFLDRDGVINKEVGYLHKSKDFEFIEGQLKYYNKKRHINLNDKTSFSEIFNIAYGGHINLNELFFALKNNLVTS